jgi:hypothetical protein
MLITSFRKFLGDESGAYTIWSLIWFSLYVGIGGLAVDMTDAYRNQTLLQSTADASALAGVMSLPDQDDALAQALSYATDNMNPAINGIVLRGSEVVFGNWDSDARIFTPSTTAPDAVHVITRRADANANPVATNFLRILSLWGIPFDRWNIATEAIAVDYVADCREGGFVAGNRVRFTNGNDFINDICVHGQNMTKDPGHDYAIEMANDNTFQRRACNEREEGPCGVQVSMPHYEYMDGSPKLIEKNDGLEEAMVEGDVYPVDALKDGVKNIINGLTDFSSGHVPVYIDPALAYGDSVVVVPIDENYPGTGDESYVAGRVYVATCKSSKALKLPTDVTISNVVIIANCPIQASNGLILENVVIASTAKGKGKDPLAMSAVNLASAARLGATDFCDFGIGGVEVYALASAQVAAKLGMNGLRAVVGGDFQFAAQGNALGVSVQAGNDIIFPAAGSKGSTYGLCPLGTLQPGGYASQYRLVL